MKKNCFTRTNGLRVMWTPALLLAMAPLVAMSQSEPQAPNAAAPEPTPTAPAGSTERVPAITQPKSLVMVDSSSYVIGAEDALQVTVWKEPTLTGTFPVRPDGMISMVLVGDVPAAGLTPMQLGKNIEARLKKYIQDPSVSVVVTAVNSQRIFVIGEVGKVGPLMLSPGMTPLQAISAAGGVTAFANSKRIYILRGAQGKQVKIPFNYKLALKGDNKQLISLQPGDTIVVP
jgi:polysaccharide biosynthesis/export protein